MPPELQPENFCQRPNEYTPTAKPLGIWFDQYLVEEIDWSNVHPEDQLYVKFILAEELAYRATLEWHELPYTPILMSQFTLTDLCRIVKPEDQHEIWQEIVEVFSTH